MSFDQTRKLHLSDIDTELLNAAWDALFRVMRDLAPDLVARLGETEPAEWIRECNLGGSEGDWGTRFAEETKKLWVESEQIREHLGPAQIISVGMVDGHRVRKNTKRDPTLAGWQAAAGRDEYERQRAIPRPGTHAGSVPTFAELVQSYFDSEKFSKLYPTTQTNRRGHLKAMGSLMQALGHKRVEEITADALIDW